MAVNRSGGALAALALAGLAYFFKNRSQVKRQVEQLGDRAQDMVGKNQPVSTGQQSSSAGGASSSSGDWSTPATGETVRM